MLYQFEPGRWRKTVASSRRKEKVSVLVIAEYECVEASPGRCVATNDEKLFSLCMSVMATAARHDGKCLHLPWAFGGAQDGKVLGFDEDTLVRLSAIVQNQDNVVYLKARSIQPLVISTATMPSHNFH
jgi:hypothetical protein